MRAPSCTTGRCTICGGRRQPAWRGQVPPHVVERILNHVTGTFGGVAGVYNRFQYLDEMRGALELWARHIGRLQGAHGEAGKSTPIAVS